MTEDQAYYPALESIKHRLAEVQTIARDHAAKAREDANSKPYGSAEERRLDELADLLLTIANYHIGNRIFVEIEDFISDNPLSSEQKQ